MPRTDSWPELSYHIPLSNLTSIENLASVVSQVCIQGIFQFSLLFILEAQEWYIPMEKNDDKVYTGYEDTSIFLFSCSQYLISAFVYNKGKPFRKPIWTNWGLISSFVIITVLNWGVSLFILWLNNLLSFYKRYSGWKLFLIIIIREAIAYSQYRSWLCSLHQ